MSDKKTQRSWQRQKAINAAMRNEHISNCVEEALFNRMVQAGVIREIQRSDAVGSVTFEAAKEAACISSKERL